MKFKYILLLLTVVINSMVFGGVTENDSLNSGGFNIKNELRSAIRFSGEAGVFGEVYSMDGRPSRRPNSTGRIFIRPTLSLYETVTISLDLFLSTEGNSYRQDMNQIALHPSWSWGKFHIGDFTHKYTPFTLSGISIRGAGLELSPGIFRFEAFGGQSQKSISDGPFNSMYARYFYSGRIGLQFDNGSGFYFNFLRSKDDVKSLSYDIFTADTNSVKSKNQVTPQENLIIGTNTVINLFNKRLSIGGEFSGSVFTKDMYAKGFNESVIPDYVNNFYNPNISSNVDFAYSGLLKLDLDDFNFKGEYSVINPGYISHGIGIMANDRRTINLISGFRLINNILSIQLNYQTQNDNLLKHKLFTSDRNTYGITANIRPVREGAIVLTYMLNQVGNDSGNDTLRTDFLSNLLAANFVYQLNLFNMLHNISLMYSNQSNKDNNILRKDNEVSVNTFSFNLNTNINQNWTVSPGINLTSINQKSIDDQTTVVYNIRVGNRISELKLQNQLNFSYSSTKYVNNSNLTLQTEYSLTKTDIIKLSLRANIYEGKTPGYFNFHELSANIGYTYRW